MVKILHNNGIVIADLKYRIESAILAITDTTVSKELIEALSRQHSLLCPAFASDFVSFKQL